MTNLFITGFSTKNNKLATITYLGDNGEEEAVIGSATNLKAFHIQGSTTVDKTYIYVAEDISEKKYGDTIEYYIGMPLTKQTGWFDDEGDGTIWTGAGPQEGNLYIRDATKDITL